MSKSRLLTGVALAVLCLPVATLSPGLPLGVSSAQAQSAGISFQLFFDQLEPHGVWARHARYNYVFCPTGVDASWRPYTRGRWLYLEDRGWYFASDEPFAWATYHYGRWFADRKLGWCWVPGTKWAPAWVSWRRSDNVVGWAPLPPEGDGFAVSIEVSRRELPEGYWVFVPTERFIEPDLSVSIVIGSEQPDYFAQTQFLGPVTVEGDIIVNNVIDVTYIEQTINQEIIVYQAEAASDPAQQSVDVDAQALQIFDQDAAEPAEEAAPPEPIEEADAAATIETEGGTAGATADLAVEAEAVAPEATQGEAPDATAEEPGIEQPANEEPTTGTAPPVPAEAEAPAEPPPAEDAAGQPVEGEEPLCPPETMVDGVCLPTPDQPAVEPETEAPVQAAPAPETAAEPAPEEPAAAPEAEAAPPAEAAPSEEPAAPEEQASPDAVAPAGEPICPPEVMVDGVCPVDPEAPAQ
jgi:hypothetical protein